MQLPPTAVFAAHLPAVHTPVQHVAAVEQLPPTSVHTWFEHAPFTQELLQQSVLVPHGPPAPRQKVLEVQTLPVQVPSQHGFIGSHAEPAPMQVPPSGSWPVLPPPLAAVPPPVLPAPPPEAPLPPPLLVPGGVPEH